MSDDTNSVELATELTIAWLSNPNTRADADAIPGFLRQMHQAVAGLTSGGDASGEAAGSAQGATPAVSVRKSLASRDHIISMVDGKPYRTLRRHLATHGLTPEQYRERYGLKPDYPMVAESYSESRRALAKQLGLGRKPRAQGAEAGATEATAQADPAEPKRGRGRRKKVEGEAAA